MTFTPRPEFPPPCERPPILGIVQVGLGLSACFLAVTAIVYSSTFTGAVDYVLVLLALTFLIACADWIAVRSEYSANVLLLLSVLATAGVLLVIIRRWTPPSVGLMLLIAILPGCTAILTIRRRRDYWAWLRDPSFVTDDPEMRPARERNRRLLMLGGLIGLQLSAVVGWVSLGHSPSPAASVAHAPEPEPHPLRELIIPADPRPPKVDPETRFENAKHKLRIGAYEEAMAELEICLEDPSRPEAASARELLDGLRIVRDRKVVRERLDPLSDLVLTAIAEGSYMPLAPTRSRLLEPIWASTVRSVLPEVLQARGLKAEK